MKLHSGSCLCGTVTFKLEGEFNAFYLCYCHYCQKDTGSAHAANLFSQSARLTWLTGESEVNTFTLPGTRHCKSFCKHCGSALPRVEMSGVTIVPAGCLDSEISLKPTARIFMRSRASWAAGFETIPKFDGLPE
ncbi:MAG: GFA family protein [Pedobacter sp.]